jgi:hypothetical protein
MRVYLDPETGILTTERRRGLLEVQGASAGLQAPALVKCTFHGRWEPVATVSIPDPRQNGLDGYRALATAACVATSPTLAAFLSARAKLSGLLREALEQRPEAGLHGYAAVLHASAPLKALARYSEAVQTACGCGWDTIIDALAAMPLPDRWDASPARTESVLVLTPSGKNLEALPGSVPPGDRLPRGKAWLARPDAGGTWRLYEAMKPVHPRSLRPLVEDLLTAAIASSADTCERARQLVGMASSTVPATPQKPLEGFAFQKWASEYSSALVRLTRNTAWQVARALEKLAEL